MRCWLLVCLLCSSALTMAAGCVVQPPSGSSPPPAGEVLPADARALAYGRSAAEVFNNPELRDKLRALFGADWAPPASQGSSNLAGPAPVYFERGGPVRMVHLADADYIAITGCAPQACAARRGLLLIREGGGELLARIDEGGFSHYYVFGVGLSAAAAPGVVDSGLRALEHVSGGDPYPRP